MSRKVSKAIVSACENYGVHNGRETINAVLAQVPQSVLQDCPARIIAEVMGAINNAYHNGRFRGEEFIKEEYEID